MKHFTKYGAVDEEDDLSDSDEENSENINQTALPLFQKKGTFEPQNLYSKEIIEEENESGSNNMEEENKEPSEEMNEYSQNTYQNNKAFFSESHDQEKRFKDERENIFYSKNESSSQERETPDYPTEKNEKMEEEIIKPELVPDFEEMLDFFQKKNHLKPHHQRLDLANYDKNELAIIDGYNKMTNNLFGNVDKPTMKKNIYHQNFSFRNSWSKNGMVTFSKSKDGKYILNIHRINVVPTVEKKNQKGRNIENYEEKMIRSLKLLFRILTGGGNEKNLDDFKRLSICDDDKDENFMEIYLRDCHDFKQIQLEKKEVFFKQILTYLYEFNEREKYQTAIFRDEVYYISLINILFGCPDINIAKFLQKAKNNLTDQKYLKDLIEKMKFKKNNLVQKYKRKMELSKWLEWKSKDVGIIYLFLLISFNF